MRLAIFTVGLGLASCSGDGSTSTGSTDITGTTGMTTSATATTDVATTSGATLDSDTAPTTSATTSATDSDTATTSGPATDSDPATTTGPATDSDTTTGTDSSTSTTDPSSSTSTGAVDECVSGDVEVCYSGPLVTIGVGLCVPGERTCTDGMWGECVGEVVPSEESCDSDADEDCDGVNPCAGGHMWSRTFNGKNDHGIDVAIDGAGYVVMLVRSDGSVDLGGDPLLHSGDVDLFLAKYAPDGKYLWSTRLGGDAYIYQLAGDLAVNDFGDIALTGSFKGSIDLGGGPLLAGAGFDAFVGKLAPDGTHLWSKVITGSPIIRSHSVALTEEGAVLLGGSFTGTIDLGGGALVSAGNTDAFVGRLSADGVHEWSKRFGDTQPQAIIGVDATVDDGVCVGGVFTSTLDLGAGPMVALGGSDGFVGCLDPQGAAKWTRQFGSTNGELFTGLAVDHTGRVNILGRSGAAVDLGGGPLGGLMPHSFVGQYDLAGKYLWSRLVSTGDAFAYDLAVDGLGAVLIAGEFYDLQDFGGGVLDSVGSADAFVLKLGSGGDYAWSKALVGSAADQANGVDGGATGTVAVTGSFLGDFNPGSGVISSAKNGPDGFLSVLAP